MIRVRFPFLCARCPVRHARVGLCRVGLRVGRFFARNQGIRLRIRYVRRPFLRVGVRVRGEGLCGGAEDGGGSGTRGSIGIGRGGGNETGTAHERLLVSLRRRIAPLLRTDDGRGGVARAGPFSTLGKGDYRGMGFFILFFSILFSSGGVRTGHRGRDVLLLGSRGFALGGCGVGVGSFVFHFRGFGLGSDRSGGKIARGVLLVGELGVEFRGFGFGSDRSGDKIARGVRLLGGLMFTLGGRVFGVGGCDFIFARRRQLLGGFVFHFRELGIPFRGFGVAFRGFFLLGGG